MMVATRGPARYVRSVPNDQRPRVAVWRDTFAPYSETFIWNEVRHHVRYRATVFARRRLNANRFPYDDVVTLDGVPGLDGVEQALAYATGLSPRFAWHLGRGGYSLIHAHFGTAGVRALPYVTAFRLPLITSFHGKDVSALVSPDPLKPIEQGMHLMAPRLFRASALILAASEDLRQQLIAGGAPPEKTKVYRLGIDLAPFARTRAEDATRTHVIMVGRCVEKKGMAYGLAAVARLVESGVDITLTIAGDGPLRKTLEDTAAQLGISERTTFKGRLNHAEVIGLMGDADVILAPSVVTPDGDRDSGIIVVKEAAAAHVPCVGTRHGGIPSIIDDDVTGFLVDEHDVDALTERLGRLASDRALRDRMGAAAATKIRTEYDIRQRIEVLEDLYDEVIKA